MRSLNDLSVDASITCELLLARGHPDPSRFHLTIVSHVVRKYLEGLAMFGIVDVGIFWDFGSLHQKPRVNNEETLFKKGLRASNRWYGSSESVVLPASLVMQNFFFACRPVPRMHIPWSRRRWQSMLCARTRCVR